MACVSAGRGPDFDRNPSSQFRNKRKFGRSSHPLAITMYLLIYEVIDLEPLNKHHQEIRWYY
jgi:hypothetical protein